jgi:hypothetical protein
MDRAAILACPIMVVGFDAASSQLTSRIPTCPSAKWEGRTLGSTPPTTLQGNPRFSTLYFIQAAA